MAVDALARALAAGKDPVDAYEMAVAGGYTGTKEQFEADMGNSAANATNAANSADAAAASATAASNAATNLAPAYSTSATYAVGDHVLYDGGYYVCNTAITTAEAWTAAHWTAVKVGPEITDLKSALEQVAEGVNGGGVVNPSLSWTSGKYVNKTTNVITAGSAQLYITDYLPIPLETNKIEIQKICEAGVAWTVAFYDSTKTFISGLHKDTTYEQSANYIIEESDIPATAKYIIVTHFDYNDNYPVTNVSVLFYCFESLVEFSEEITFLQREIDGINDGDKTLSLSWINSKRLDENGSIVNAGADFDLTQAIPVNNDPFYELVFSGLNGINNGSTIAFYDINNTKITGGYYNVNGTYSIEKEDIPEGAYYLYVSQYTANGHGTNTVSVIKRYSERINDIETDITRLNGTLETVSDDFYSVNDETFKNILKDAETFTDNKFVNDQGNVVTNNNFCLIDGYFPVKPETTYKLYRGEPALYSNAGHNWTFWDKDKHFLSYTLSAQPVTSPANAAFLRFAVYISNTGSATHANFDPTNVVITEDGKPCFNRTFTPLVSRPVFSGKKWIGIGDSITEDNFRAAYHYHDYIKAETGLSFVNMGVSGSGYKAEGSGNKAFYKRVTSMATDADLITIFGGVNDVVLSNATIGTETDDTTDTICGCVNATIDEIEELYPAHMPIGIISPLPCYCTDTTVNLNPYQKPDDDTNRMSQFVEQLALICKHRGIPFLDLFHCSNLRPWHSECNAKYFSCDSAPTGDGLHPNGHGHRLFYRQIMDFINKIVMS